MIPLHVHSFYSFLKGTVGPQKLIDRAAELNLPALAITDTNGMYGVIKFAKYANEKKIKPVIGTMITEPENENDYVLLLAKNNDGYKDICKIITARKLNDDFSIYKLIKGDLPNLFIISPSLKVAETINSKNDFYIELINSNKYKDANRKLIEFAEKNGKKFVATNPVYFLEKNDFEVHKTVSAIRLNTNIDNLEEDDLVDEQFYFDDVKTVGQRWKRLPQALKASEYIAKNCNVNLKLNEYKFPVFNLPEGKNADSYLWNLAFDGLKNRYDTITEKINTRLKYELSVIHDMNFSNYFLIVWDIVREAKRRGMMIIGRGSAANSLVAYSLGLTQVDPIEHNLYFERFLNKARSSPPDVDIDFSWKERDEIIKYIFEKYGYERVAMICTTVTFRARSAFREVAKAFGFTNAEISKFSRKIPWTDAKNLPNLSKLFPEAKSLGFDREPWKTVVDIASRIARFPRHLSIHPGGIVITPTKITDYVALEYAKNKGLGLIITQPDMYSIEDLGLVKIDILSQRSLGVLRDTMESINKRSSTD